MSKLPIVLILAGLLLAGCEDVPDDLADSSEDVADSAEDLADQLANDDYDGSEDETGDTSGDTPEGGLAGKLFLEQAHRAGILGITNLPREGRRVRNPLPLPCARPDRPF